MSRTMFQIEYGDSGIRLEEIFSVMTEIAREMDLASRTTISMLNWIRSTSPKCIEDVCSNIDKPIFEVKVPLEFKKGASVSEEILRVIPLNDNAIQVMITDASLSPKKCEDVAVDFAQRLYEKATGKKIRRDQILIKGTASLAENICEHCLQKVEGFPYVCKICRRTFCYEHRRPETHGCQLKRMEEETEPPARHLTTVHQPIADSEKTRPAVTVKRIPCG
ncbi:MAG: AN1-type zinc finger domain-containing protein [Thermoproteota archaeon]